MSDKEFPREIAASVRRMAGHFPAVFVTGARQAGKTKLLCFLLGLGGEAVTGSYLVGAIWETFVFGELRKYLSLAAPEASIWYYRDQSRETDFIIEKDGLLTLAEAKWKELPTPRDFARALKVHKLLGGRARWPVMMLCRTRQSFPVAETCLP